MIKKLLLSLTILSFIILATSFQAYAKPSAKNDSKVVVYYFYGKPRCVSCKKIETYTQQTVSSLNNSKVIYSPINIDDKANSHYSKKYKLFTKSVVISKVKNGKEVKYKNLTEIWTKLGNENDFKTYVTKEINQYLGE